MNAFARRGAVWWGFAAAVVLTAAAACWIGVRFDALGRAGAAYDRRQYRTALDYARGYLKVFPGDRRASLMAARCLTRLGRAREAEPHYRRAEPLPHEDMQLRA